MAGDAGAEDKDFARRVRKGAGADTTASGATRVAGSLNFKDKYAPDFPRVAIHAADPGRKATPTELERLGLVAAPEVVEQPRAWPLPVRDQAAATQMAELRRLSGRRAAKPEPTEADARQHRGFHLVPDCGGLGLAGGGHRPAADGGKRQGQRKRRGLRAEDSHARGTGGAAERRTPPAAQTTQNRVTERGCPRRICPVT